MLKEAFYQFTGSNGPQRWYFKDPDTQRVFVAKTKAELITHIETYRQQNELETLEMLSAVIDNFLCKQIENAGKCRIMPFRRGIMQYVKGGVALLTNLLYPKVVVQKEAERRAKICTECKYNILPNKNTLQTISDEIAWHSVGDKKTEVHAQLGTCEVCTCPLKAKVFYGGKVKLTAPERKQMEEVSCWQIEADPVEKLKLD